MSKIIVTTDSNSGITQAQGNELGIRVLPMPFLINEETYYEDINLSQKEFFEKLRDDVAISTSQPSIENLTNLWDEVLKEADEIVHIPMSSGLSGSCQTAMMVAQDYDGKVQVIDNQRISVTQYHSVMDALALAKEGKNAQEIKKILEDEKFNSTIYIMMGTLTYLKRGGRITPAAAALGSALRLKPVLQIHGEKLDAYSIARTKKQGINKMIAAMEKDINEQLGGTDHMENIELAVAHTENQEAADELAEELKNHFGADTVTVAPLSLSVSCHIGPGALAVACSLKAIR